MRLIMDDDFKEFDNSESGIKDMIKTIEERASSSSDKFFSHLIVDGTPVYDNFAEYLEENIRSVRRVEVVFLTIREYVDELLLSTGEYLARAVPAVEQLANAFYSQVDSETWNQVNDLLEGIQWLLDTFGIMESIPNFSGFISDYEQWNLYSQGLRELEEAAASLEEPLKLKDYVTVGDILLYEVKQAMDKMSANIPSIK